MALTLVIVTVLDGVFACARNERPGRGIVSKSSTKLVPRSQLRELGGETNQPADAVKQLPGLGIPTVLVHMMGDGVKLGARCL